MKKFFSFLLLVSCALMLLACGGKDKLEFSVTGWEDKTYTVGQQFQAASMGVTITDSKGNEYSITDDAVSISFGSPRLNYNQAGEYPVTLTIEVEGSSFSKTIIIKYEDVDTQAPVLAGVGAADVLVGLPFNKLAGVSAIDNKDGNITSRISVVGEVDVDHLGVYALDYSVTDAAGNVATKRRSVTVSTGAFLFKDADAQVQQSVVFTHSAESTRSDDLVKVVYSVPALAAGATQQQVVIKVGDKEVTNIHKNKNAESGAAYFYFASAPSVAQAITITGATFTSWILGDAADSVKPTFTGSFDQVFPITQSAGAGNVSLIIDMAKAKASDDRDGFITDKITCDFSAINWSSKEQQTVKLQVADKAGNVGEQSVNVVVNQVTELANLSLYIDGEANPIFNPETKGKGQPVAEIRGFDTSVAGYGVAWDATEKAYVFHGLKSGGYTSACDVKYNFGSMLTVGNYYMLVLTVRAKLEDSVGQLTQGMGYRIGYALGGDPWYEEFYGCCEGGDTYFNMTGEYTTIYHMFKVTQERQSEGNPDEAMEFQLGNTSWGTIYDVCVRDFRLYLVSNEDQAPQLNATSQSKVIVMTDSVEPKDFFTASDVEDGDLTSSIVITGSIDKTKAGMNTLKFEVTDSKGHKVEKTIEVEVLTEKDSSKPTITAAGAPSQLNINQMTNEQAMAALKQLVQIKDTKNGAEYSIALEDSMISSNLDLTKVGKYTVTITAKDSSGNVGTLELVIRVIDPNAVQTTEELIKEYVGTAHSSENITCDETTTTGVMDIVPTSFNNDYASTDKAKFELQGLKLEVGKKYMIIIEAKADVARDVRVAVSCSNSDYSQWGGAGSLIAGLTSEYAKYKSEVFEFTGKFTKGTTEYDIAYAAIEFQVGKGTDFGFKGELTTENHVYVKSIGIYEVSEMLEDQLLKDLMPTADGMVGESKLHTIENVTVGVADGVATVTPATGITSNQWASYCKFKYEGLQSLKLEVGKTYAFILEAKADVARKVQLSLVPDWTGSKAVTNVVNLTADYQTLVVEFQLTQAFASVGNIDLEFHFGQVNSEGSATADNKIYIKQFKLVEPAQEVKYNVMEKGTFYKNGGTAPATTAGANGSISFEVAANVWYGYNTFKAQKGMKYAVITMKASVADNYIEYKVDDSSNSNHNKRVGVTMTKTAKRYIIDLEAWGITDASKLFKFCFYGNKSCTITIYECYFTNKAPEALEEVKFDLMTNGTLYSTGTLGTPSVTAEGVTISTVANAWYGLNAITAPKGMKYCVVTMKCSEAVYTEFKVDANENPYHNNRSKETVGTEFKTYIIDLSEIGCTDSSKIIKFCLTQYSKGVDYTIAECYLTNVLMDVEVK